MYNTYVHVLYIFNVFCLSQEPSVGAGSEAELAASGEGTPEEQPPPLTEEEDRKDEIELILQEKEEKIKDFQVCVEMCVQLDCWSRNSV